MQKWSHSECRWTCKELDDWASCKDNYTWNPSACDGECNKACKVDEYLDTKNYSCKKHLFGKLDFEDEIQNTTEISYYDNIAINCLQKNTHINDIKILYFDRIDISEGIAVNKTSVSKECIICHYRYFLDKGFKFQPDPCNGCNDVLMMSMNLNDIVILNIRGIDYRCIINEISESEAVNLLQNVDLSEKSGSLKKIIFLYRV